MKIGVRKLVTWVALAGGLGAQTLLVDRGRPAAGAAPLMVERGAGRGFLGDSFQVGAKGDVWVLDTVRVWAAAPAAASCPQTPGDLVEKIVLLGALDNPPVPGQPACACHALIKIAAAEFSPGAAAPADANEKLAVDGGLWRLDFGNLRWSVPGGMDILYAVRPTARAGAPAGCDAARGWSVSASAASANWRLFTFDKDALEDGFSAPDPPRWLNLQVWGHRSPQEH